MRWKSDYWILLLAVLIIAAGTLAIVTALPSGPRYTVPELKKRDMILGTMAGECRYRLSQKREPNVVSDERLELHALHHVLKEALSEPARQCCIIVTYEDACKARDLFLGQGKIREAFAIIRGKFQDAQQNGRNFVCANPTED